MTGKNDIRCVYVSGVTTVVSQTASRLKGFFILTNPTAAADREIDFTDASVGGPSRAHFKVPGGAGDRAFSVRIPEGGVPFRHGIYVSCPASLAITVFCD